MTKDDDVIKLAVYLVSISVRLALFGLVPQSVFYLWLGPRPQFWLVLRTTIYNSLFVDICTLWMVYRLYCLVALRPTDN